MYAVKSIYIFMIRIITKDILIAKNLVTYKSLNYFYHDKN